MKKTYNSQNIKILKGLQAVRERPSMYIGDIGFKGLHHLIFQVIDNSIDEHLAGYCDKINITLTKTNSVIIQDNGRGIPIDKHKDVDLPAVQVVLTTLHAGGKFDKDTYKVSGGLHGVGVSVVNALSNNLKVTVLRDNKICTQQFSKGSKLHQLKIKNKKSKVTGTTIQFTPDFQIFECKQFEKEYLIKRLKQLCFLNKNLSIEFFDQREDYKQTLNYKEGLLEYIKYLNSQDQLLFQPIVLSGKHQDIEYQICFSYNNGYQETVLGYVNNINTYDGGTHISGFKNGLTIFISNLLKESSSTNKQKFKNVNVTGNDIRQGIIAIISIKIPNPQFEGQTKAKLHNSNIESKISQIVNNSLTQSNKKTINKINSIIQKILTAAKIRLNLRKTKQVLRKNNQLNGNLTTSLPGKLADCISKSNKGTELYLVQGDSAGGSAKQGRDRKFQAILPLWGKITNVQKLSVEKTLSNQKINPLLTVLGLNLAEQFDIEKLRYQKIIIMTDADVDGQHILTLLLTFFYRFFPQLIQNQRLFIANSPLFVINHNNKKHYVFSNKQKDQYIKKLGNSNYTLQRFKGLGEMNPKQLWETTMNPKTRTLTKVIKDDQNITQFLFTSFMGDDIDIRKQLIMEQLQKVSV